MGRDWWSEADDEKKEQAQSKKLAALRRYSARGQWDDLRRLLEWKALTDGGETDLHSHPFDENYWAAIGGGVPAGDPASYNIVAIANIGTMVYVAGSLKINTAIQHISAYDTLTGTWTDISSTMEGKNALCVIGTDLYAAGYHFIDKWNGTTWTRIGEAFLGGDDNAPDIVALATDGTNLYAGGVFNHMGTVDVFNVAMWDGANWTALGAGVGSDQQNRIYALACQDTDLIVGGMFTVAQGAVGNFLAKWDGEEWSAYTDEPNATVRAIATDETTIYIGGDFTAIGTEAIGYVAMWDGETWEAMAELNGACHALAVAGDTVYVGGDFTTINEEAMSYLAKWKGEFSVLAGGTDGRVSALLFLDDVLYVGGRFSNVGTGTGAKVAARIAAYIMAFDSLVRNLGTGAESAVWGRITGDIDNQLDLVAKLLLKVDVHQSASRVVVTDATGHVSTNADINYDAANNALTIGSETLPIVVANALNVIAASGSLGRFDFVFADTLDNSSYDTTLRGGGTSSAPTKVLDDMVIKKWRGRGYYNNTGGISNTNVELRMVADGDWSDTSRPTRIEIWTTPVDSVTLTKALTVGSDGILYDGAGNPMLTYPDLAIGAEEIVDGRFYDTVTYWTVGAGWAWESAGGGYGRMRHTAGNTESFYQNKNLIDDVYYHTFFNFNGTAGTVDVYLGETFIGQVIPTGVETAFNLSFIGGHGAKIIEFRPSSDFDGYIHYISVKRAEFLQAPSKGSAIWAKTESGWQDLSTVVSDSHAAGSDTSVAAKAITVASLDDGTDGELITWGADGVATTVPVGTATHVLTSNGAGAAPTFQAPAAGAESDPVFLASEAADLAAGDAAKLAGIAAGAQVNVLEGVTGTAPIVAGAVTAKSQAISISAATTGAAGSMSSADKTKLDSVATGAQSPWVCVEKPSDESRQSDTTVTSDSHLRFTAAVNKTYAVRGHIWFSTPAAADFKFRFAFAGTSIFIHEVSIPCGSATETVGIETGSPTTTISCLGTGTTGGYIEFDGVLVCDATPRTFLIQWAQVTSTASNTILKAGSYLEYLQVN